MFDMSYFTKIPPSTKSKHLTTYRHAAAWPDSNITITRCTWNSGRAGISFQHKVSRAESCGIFSSSTVVLACGMSYIKQRSEQASITTALSTEQGNLGGKKAFNSLPAMQVLSRWNKGIPVWAGQYTWSFICYSLIDERTRSPKMCLID